MTEILLSKFFQGQVYAEAIHDELGQQLGITNHQKFTGQRTGNHSINYGWQLALYEFAFKQENSPSPQPNPNNEYQLLVNDLKYIQDKFVVINNREIVNDSDLKDWFPSKFKSFWMFCEDAKNGLVKIQQLQTELPNHANDQQWITQNRNDIRQKHNWLFKNFQSKNEAENFCDLQQNEVRFKYVNRIWQNQ